MLKNLRASELKSFYLDGVKYLENLTPGDFLGKLKAFTYPDEFDSVNGIAHVAPRIILLRSTSQKVLICHIEQELVMILRE